MAKPVQRLPIVVLGGGDVVASAMPEGVEDTHALSGYKGAAVRIGGRALIECVLERLEASDLFAPIYIAGPRSINFRSPKQPCAARALRSAACRWWGTTSPGTSPEVVPTRRLRVLYGDYSRGRAKTACTSVSGLDRSPGGARRAGDRR